MIRSSVACNCGWAARVRSATPVCRAAATALLHRDLLEQDQWFPAGVIHPDTALLQLGDDGETGLRRNDAMGDELPAIPANLSAFWLVEAVALGEQALGGIRCSVSHGIDPYGASTLFAVAQLDGGIELALADEGRQRFQGRGENDGMPDPVCHLLEVELHYPLAGHQQPGRRIAVLHAGTNAAGGGHDAGRQQPEQQRQTESAQGEPA